MKNFLLIIVSGLFFFAGMGCGTNKLSLNQENKISENVKRIENMDYTFTPYNAQPMTGRSISLDYFYYLTVKKDTIEAYLPYYGRLYTVPGDITDLSINFTSTNFEYSSENNEKGVYTIKIEPQDIRKPELQGMHIFLSIGDSGYGTLNIQSTNRQNISYYGSIDE